jgi:hypothetical protein
MSKKFGDYQIQTGVLYSTPDGYRVSIDVRREILSIKIRWKAAIFMPSSRVHIRFDEPEQFYSDLLQITKKIQSKSYLNKQSTTWWEKLLSPFEGEYIYLGELCRTPVSISKNKPENCEIGDDTFLPTEVLFSLIRKISKDSLSNR